MIDLEKPAPDGFYHPEREEDIIALVRYARANRRKIRVRGAGHSVAHAIYADPLSGIANKVKSEPTRREGHNINVALDLHVGYTVKSQAQRLVEVKAGTRLGDYVDEEKQTCPMGLLRLLSTREGWMLCGTGGIAHQTVGGFTATGSAGGSLQRSVNDSICGFRLIDGVGEVWEVRKGVDAEFDAMVPNLGLLGIVSTVTFRCEEDFYIAGMQTTSRAADAALDLSGDAVSLRTPLREFLEKTPYGRIEWWPQRGADRVVVWEAKPEPRPPDPPPPQEPWKPVPFELFRGKDPALAQALIGVTYTVLGNLDDLRRVGPGVREIVARMGEDEQLLAAVEAILRDMGRVGGFVADRLLDARRLDFGEALASAQAEAARVSDLIPQFFPTLLGWFIPPDSEQRPPPNGGPQCFHDHAWRSLPMDHAVDDVYMPVEFTEIWVPMREAETVMRCLNAYFDQCDTKNSYRRTGTFAIELYAEKANRFWMNPAYTTCNDEWVDGAFRINPFWYGRNAGDPAARFFPQFWNLLQETGVPFRLHWGKFLPVAEQDPNWVDRVRARYPMWQAFLDLRSQRDPDRIFLSEYWCRQLGLDGCDPPRYRNADLHCHFPMHVLADRSAEAVADRRVCSRKRWWWLDGLRAWLVRRFAQWVNYPRGSSPRRPTEWRVSFDGLCNARTGVVLSVLYDVQFELIVWPGWQRPRKRSFDALLCHLRCVEQALAREDPDNLRHRVVQTEHQLDAALDSGRMAVVHCIEGGFFLGPEEHLIAERVGTLAELGVVYITLAHLFYRGVATNTSAFPGVSDACYDWLCPQHGYGLSARGRAAVTAMYDHNMLIDISHMDAASLAGTFALLNDLDTYHGLDPEAHPVIATHAGVRFGGQQYMLDKPTILEIKRRGGVIGLILAKWQLNDHLPAEEIAEDAFRAVKLHVDRIHAITGSHEHTCIGSDLDGFIKPIGGIETSESLGTLASWLHDHYSTADADAILFGNVERVVRTALPAG